MDEDFDVALTVEVIKPGMDGYAESCKEHNCPGCAKLWAHHRTGESDLLIQYLHEEREVQVNPLTSEQLRRYFLCPEEYETMEEHREGSAQGAGIRKLMKALNIDLDLKGGQDCGHN